VAARSALSRSDLFKSRIDRQAFALAGGMKHNEAVAAEEAFNG
jgi:hypothetical protein